MKKVISALITIASTAAIITTTAIAAEAATICKSGPGWEACASSGTISDQVVLNYGGRYETFQIRCSSAGWAYESTGQLTKAEADEYVEGYCEGRGPAHS